ncbi:MAG: multicopper oxidase domain-containing protein [Acidimicrobiia bacterium]|nr:multicopper oxidase domain-containing protein [Acidimicrobiia bacterium]
MMFTLLTVILAFAALAVAGKALSNSEDAQDTAALGGSGTKVGLTEFALSPEDVNAEPDSTIAVSNDGTVEHNLAIQGTDTKTANLKPGEKASLDLGGLKAGHYTIFCTIPGHEAAGMKGMLMIGGGASTAAGAAEAGSAGGTTKELLASNDAEDAQQKKVVDAYVAQLKKGPNTKGVGNQPLAPTVLADGTKEFKITSKIVDWEVEPGKKVRAWAYGPTGAPDEQFTVPGPLLKVAVGDKVRFVFENKLPQSSAVHFHGVELPNAMDGVPFVTQDPVKPGKTFVYEFVANRAQTSMYHSHHHAEHQVPDGQLGVFQIGDMPVPVGRNVPDQVVPMVLNDAGSIGLTLNAKSFPATAPVIASPGQTVQVDYYNEGLLIHPMHLHGIIQTVIAKDGYPIAPYETDTLNVAPGERWSVLITPRADQTGVWAYHCHILTHAERDNGMFGMVTTFIVQ